MSLALLLSVAMLPAPARVVQLSDALAAGRNRPANVKAQLSIAVSRAQVGESLSTLLPSVTGTASYQRSTSNYVARPSQVPTDPTVVTTSFNTYNFFSFGLQVNQLLYDSQVSIDRFRAAQANAEASKWGLRVAELATDLEIRTAYFSALAQKELSRVAAEALANEDRHMKQVEGFVRVGTRPEIDLAQERTLLANAKVALVQATGAFETARAQLNLSMGRLDSTNYDVADVPLVPLEGEESGLDPLITEAEKARPDIVQLEKRIRVYELQLSAQKGNYGPALSTSMGLTYAGRDIDKLVWNWNAGVNLTWNIFSGLNTWNAVKEADANLRLVKADRDQLRLQVQLDVNRALVAVKTAKEALLGANEALDAAKERLRLAEGRYTAGVGNIIEQSDAQLALTQAAAQRVQAQYTLATARAQLVSALGRD